MEKQDFIEFLSSETDHFDMADAPMDGKDGLYVKNKTYDTETHFTNDVISQMELKDLVVATHQGRNIEHMTRVTGYFSKVQGWNKGKVGELKDRSRVGDL
ncbi:MAG: hypothetical protein KAJ64_00575 [Thermoplasmata archaeon]|nr:hypothetical protein [Thermoplasmata archaeon]